MEATFFNLIISWSLVGLIWAIQLVHYPTFEFISTDDFLTFHQHHTNSITPIVMPLMLGELGLGLYLAQQQKWSVIWLIPLVLILCIWLSTFIIQVPIHNQLGIGKDSVLISRLVQTNWIRTTLWTIKAIWLSYYFIRIPVK